jgi:O-antigen/teichoic acid export membrane protein
VIPPERLNAAFWVLQMSTLYCFVNVMSTPYNAIIVAYERMASFAYITVLNSLLLLGICFLVLYFPEDKLIFYAVLLACESILIRIIYMVYCRKNFDTIRGKTPLQLPLLKELASFAGWNTLGNVAQMSINQGTTFLLNIFFGPVVNAANGVATQVTNMVSSFSSNIRMAINPQITKSYSQGNWEYMHELIRMSSVYPFYLILICLIPLWLVCEFLLRIWLTEVPEYAVSFVRLGLLYILLNSFGGPMITGIHATGKIKKFQIVEGCIMLLYFPLAYLLLYWGFSPNFIYVALIIDGFLTQLGRVYVVLPVINLSYSFYWHRVACPCLKTLGIGIVILYGSSLLYAQYPLLAFLACSFLVVAGIYVAGIESNERKFIQSFIRKKIFHKLH